MLKPLTEGETRWTLAAGLTAAAIAAGAAWAIMAPIPTPPPPPEIKVYYELRPGPWEGDPDKQTQIDVILAPFPLDGRTIEERCEGYGGYLEGTRCIDISY